MHARFTGGGRSAPRSRGLLSQAAPGAGIPGVGPALAGIAPAWTPPPPWTPCRPRARGDCSINLGTVNGGQRSAPRSRGLLLGMSRAAFYRMVGPALAGIAPTPTGRSRRAPRRPRARGDCSGAEFAGAGKPRSAPRSRGLLGLDGLGVAVADVGPALAGIAPGGARCCSGAASRPRARGDCSRPFASGSTPARSAPRSRGLLPVHRHRPAPGQVGPVLAGIAPSTVRPGRRRGGRPRARGDCSQPQASGSADQRSAPRSRGLLQDLGR